MVEGQVQGILSFHMQYALFICNITDIVTENAENASAGNRTRIYCLGSNNANHYTTNALVVYKKNSIFVISIKGPLLIYFSMETTASVV